MSPTVSIVMPVYNAEKTLRESMYTVLSQTYTDFELIALDDCSTDSTPQILASFGDPRIRIIRNEQNLGITRNLNKGLDLSTGTYIARMDADDLALPNRLRCQVAHMDANPDVVLLGSKYQHIDDEGEFLFNAEISPPTPDSKGSVGWMLLFLTAIQHPTAMLRREVIEKHGMRYDLAYETAEDYEFWTRIARIGRVERLSAPHLYYRVTSTGISQTRRIKQMQTHFRVSYEQISDLLGSEAPKVAAYTLVRTIVHHMTLLEELPPPDYRGAADLLLRLRDAYVARYADLTRDDRDFINDHCTELLSRMMAQAKAAGDNGTRFYVGSRILQVSPLAFGRMGSKSICRRLRRDE
jgi:glycosyltransferase involved in cell wall biosynthesis